MPSDTPVDRKHQGNLSCVQFRNGVDSSIHVFPARAGPLE